MSQKALLDFYESVLNSLWIYDNGDGSLSMNILDPTNDDDDTVTKIPSRSAGKRLVLPTKQILKEGNWEERIAFHPLSENLLRGESDVFKTMVDVMRFRVGTTIGVLMSVMMEIATDPKLQGDLTARQQKFLQAVGKVDKKAVKAIDSLIQTANLRLFSVFVHRGGGANDINHRRVAQASFPIWEELHGPGSKIKSSNLSKYQDIECGSVKNKRAIAALFEYIIPDPDDKEEWSAGSDNDVAPYFDALLNLYGKTADHLNSIIHLFRKYIPHDKWLRFDLDWVDDLENIDKWKNKIPALPGNTGAIMKGETEEEFAEKEASNNRPSFLAQAGTIGGGQPSDEGQVTNQDVPPWENPPTQQPQPMQANTQQSHPAPPPPAESGNGLDWRQLRQQQHQQQNMGYQQPMPAQNGFMGGYQQPQQQPMGYQQPQNAHATFNPNAQVTNHHHPRFLGNSPAQPMARSGSYPGGGYGGGGL